MREWGRRAVVDVLVIAAVIGVVVMGLWAYQGHVAYVFLQQIQQQQRAASAPAK